MRITGFQSLIAKLGNDFQKNTQLDIAKWEKTNEVLCPFILFHFHQFIQTNYHLSWKSWSPRNITLTCVTIKDSRFTRNIGENFREMRSCTWRIGIFTVTPNTTTLLTQLRPSLHQIGSTNGGNLGRQVRMLFWWFYVILILI